MFSRTALAVFNLFLLLYPAHSSWALGLALKWVNLLSLACSRKWARLRAGKFSPPFPLLLFLFSGAKDCTQDPVAPGIDHFAADILNPVLQVTMKLQIEFYSL